MPRKPKTDKQMATEKAINKNYTYAEIIDVISLDVVHSLNSDAAIKILTNDINIIQELMTRDTKNTANNLKCLYALHALMLPLAPASVNRQDVLHNMIGGNRKALQQLIADALKQPRPDEKLLKRTIEKRSGEPDSAIKEYMIKSANIILEILPCWDEIHQELLNWADAVVNYQPTRDSNESSQGITNETENWKLVDDKLAQDFGYETKAEFRHRKNKLIERINHHNKQKADEIKSWFRVKNLGNHEGYVTYFNMAHFDDLKKELLSAAPIQIPENWKPVNDELAQEFGYKTKKSFVKAKENLLNRRYKNTKKADEIKSWFRVKNLGNHEGCVTYFNMAHFDEFKALLQNKSNTMPKVETVKVASKQKQASGKQNLTDAKVLEAVATTLSKADSKLATKQTELNQAQAEFNAAKEKVAQKQKEVDEAKAERDVAKSKFDKAKEVSKTNRQMVIEWQSTMSM